MPPTDQNKAWSLATRREMDRDIHRTAEPFITTSGEYANATIECKVEDPFGTRREVQKEVSVRILDEDDNPPVAQEKSILKIHLKNNTVWKVSETVQIVEERCGFYVLGSGSLSW